MNGKITLEIVLKAVTTLITAVWTIYKLFVPDSANN